VRALASGWVVAAIALASVLARDAGATQHHAPSIARLATVSRAGDLALSRGRITAQDHLDRAVAMTVDAVSPPGTWAGHDDGLARARRELARLFTAATTGDEHARPAWLSYVVRHSLEMNLDEAERLQAITFYESPGGSAWLAKRLTESAHRAFQQPFGPDGEAEAPLAAAATAAAQAFERLPADEREAVRAFTESPAGDRLRCAEDYLRLEVSDGFGSDLELVAARQQTEFVATVRGHLGDALPRSTDKIWLGTVTMESDRTLAATIEHRDAARVAGRYEVRYAPDTRHHADLLAAVPTIAPGETRQLFRDPHGRMSDRP